MIPTKTKITLLPLLILASLCVAQTPGAPLAAKATAAPAVTFSFDFPQSQPSNYSIVVQSSGEAEYRTAAGEETSPAPDITNFTMSPATRSQIFDLAQRARFFDGNFNYKGKVANTGTKTLAFDDESRHFHTTYNYSTNPAIQQLTEIFEGISDTMQFGRNLEDAYQHQRLALDEQLKSMEEQAKDGRLQELQAIAPILKEISDDPSVMNIARARAQRLLLNAGEQGRSPK